MQIGEKIKLIREVHGYNRVEFANILSMPKSSLEQYERETRSPSGKALLKITEHFPQYALWFTTNTLAPESGQIAPGDDIPKMCNNGVPAELLDAAFERMLTASIALGWLTPKPDIQFSMLADLLRHDFVAEGGKLIERSEDERDVV